MGASLFTEGSATAMTAEEVASAQSKARFRRLRSPERLSETMRDAPFARVKGEATGGEITPGVKSRTLVIPANELATVSGMVESTSTA